MKISEKKALEAYPKVPSPYYGDEQDRNLKYRFGFIQGYDQAMQDFLEKAEEAIADICCHCVGEDYSFEQIWERFKQYMEDE